MSKPKKQSNNSPSKTEKGRQAARRFREKQNDRVIELGNQIAELEAEQDDYLGKIENLRSQNAMLTNQQQLLRQALQEHLQQAALTADLSSKVNAKPK